MCEIITEIRSGNVTLFSVSVLNFSVPVFFCFAFPEVSTKSTSKSDSDSDSRLPRATATVTVLSVSSLTQCNPATGQQVTAAVLAASRQCVRVTVTPSRSDSDSESGSPGPGGREARGYADGGARADHHCASKPHRANGALARRCLTNGGVACPACVSGSPAFRRSAAVPPVTVTVTVTVPRSS